MEGCFSKLAKVALTLGAIIERCSTKKAAKVQNEVLQPFYNYNRFTITITRCNCKTQFQRVFNMPVHDLINFI